MGELGFWFCLSIKDVGEQKPCGYNQFNCAKCRSISVAPKYKKHYGGEDRSELFLLVILKEKQ